MFNKTDATLIKDLGEFITFERQCVRGSFFAFQPEEGPVSLDMGDSEETKEMVCLVMQLDKLQPSR